MNRLTLKDVLKSKIEQLSGIQFNEIIDAIFSFLYGAGYKSIKQKRDLGSDGIIETEKLCLACYAPEKYERRKFEKKADEDYLKYKKNYENLGYKWRFIINQEILGHTITYIKMKDPRADIWGVNELISFILNLTPSKRRKILSGVFFLSPELIEFDFMEEVIAAISSLRGRGLDDYTPRYDPPEDTVEKIKKNFTGEDIEIVKRKFALFYGEHIGYLQRVLESSDSDFISNLKMRVLSEYQILDERLTFKKRLNHLVKRFASKYPNDQEYENYIELILLYLFEQCLIGAKPEVKK